MQRKLPGLIATSVLVLGALACGVDGPSAPSAPARVADGPALLSARAMGHTRREHPGQTLTELLDTVTVLRRTMPLRSTISRSVEIGPDGGEIRIREAGVRIVFPAGAVGEPTTITMTATGGWNVAYEFEPHGLQFAAPVTIEQDLRGTLAARFRSMAGELQGAYYDTTLGDGYVDPWHLFATVRENLSGKSDHRRTTFSFEIHHFSGYLVSSGRKGTR
jgi:hypothetical protein